MRTMCLLLVVACAAVLAADEPKDANKDLKKLQGTWTASSVIYNGKEVSSDKLGELKMVFKGDEAVVKASKEVEKEYAKVRVKLDPSTTPACIDISVTSGSQKDNKFEGIYELKGDELKICARILGTDRPTKFESPEGQSIVLIVLKRDKE